MPIYNKLVRDRIPEVISKSGKQSVTRILSDDEYKLELQKKLGEEIQEYIMQQRSYMVPVLRS
jgi:predicted house-cleaning noncanonical NTP pyrophosphatase (MazG superfamily)